MPSNFYRIRVHVDNLLLRRHIEEAVVRKPEFIIQDVKDSQRTDLLIIEISKDPHRTLEIVHSLISNDQVGEIFVASSFDDQDILIKALRSGAREFFGPSTDELDVISALKRFTDRHAGARDEKSESCKVITVMGGKGGVGATSVAVNLAVSFTRNGSNNSAALVDMNLFGDIPLFLERENRYSWQEIIRNISRLDSTYLKHVLSRDPSGVHVLPSPTLLDNSNMHDGSVFERLGSVMSDMFDYLIVDAGPGLNNDPEKILQMSDKVIMVGVQNQPCLKKISEILKIFEELGFPVSEDVLIVMNRFQEKADPGREGVEKYLNTRLFWCLPNDYSSTISAINKGQPLAISFPRKKITKSFMEMSQLITREPAENEVKTKRFWFF